MTKPQKLVRTESGIVANIRGEGIELSGTVEEIDVTGQALSDVEKAKAKLARRKSGKITTRKRSK